MASPSSVAGRLELLPYVVSIGELHGNVGLNPSGGGAEEVQRWPCPHWFRRWRAARRCK